jgi:hypothetical protein
MMSLTFQREPGQIIDGYLRNTAFSSIAGLWRSLSSPVAGLQNMVRRMKSQMQAITQVTANQAVDITGAEPASGQSKRGYVQTDCNIMKNTCCLTCKRGCDGGRSQCENCGMSREPVSRWRQESRVKTYHVVPSHLHRSVKSSLIPNVVGIL